MRPSNDSTYLVGITRHIRVFILPTIMFMAVGMPDQSSAQEVCAVTDSDIKGAYQGQCQQGLAHGQGTATGKDKYVGDFLNGKKHGQGTYTWSDKTEHQGTYIGDRANGFGTRRFPREYITKHPSWTNIEAGKWEGDVYVVTGLFYHGSPFVKCINASDCKQRKLESDARRDRIEREKYEKACNNFYPGKIGKVRGSGFLATSDGYIVRYVNNERKMVTIEGTTGGNSLNRGQLTELSCVTLVDLER